MRLWNKKRTIWSGLSILTLGLTLSFQNCSKVNFQDTPDLKSVGQLGVCEGISCDLDPLTSKPAVTTILLALGDEANAQLVVNGASSQLIAETVVRYTTPKTNPKILFIHDSGSTGESASDTTYVKEQLLGRYDVTLLKESSEGTKIEELEGYDIVWINNPGYPMGSKNTRDALLAFKGGVVIQGDDMSRGNGFDLEALTGLKYVDNGTSVRCEGKDYGHDGNAGEQYRVSLAPDKIPGADASTIEFRYGNDIDNTTPARADLEILAVAKGGPEVCTELRPAIVRYLKN
jgi:hypothetical protein